VEPYVCVNPVVPTDLTIIIKTRVRKLHPQQTISVEDLLSNFSQQIATIRS
jgi:hypothetical protein